MKKIIILSFVFIFFFAFSAAAQQFGGGLKAGMNFSQVDGDNHGGFHKFGFVGGGFINYPIGKKSLLQAELLFSQKGSRTTATEENPDQDELEINVKYIDVPLIFGYQLVKNTWIQVGLTPSILISGEELENGTPTVGNPGFSTLNLSALFGVNYQFATHFSVTGMWSYSITNIRDNEYSGYSRSIFGYGQFNSVISLTLQYHF